MKINNVLDEINLNRTLGSSNQCYDIMYAITRAFQVKTIVEIGTHQGASAITFCQAILDNNYEPKIYTIDSWVQADKKDIAVNNFSKAGFGRYITLIEGDSKIKVPELFTVLKKVDLIFIDGDHSVEAIMIDYNNCKEHSNLIFFHDTGDGTISYLKTIEAEGWKRISFPTKYIEGDLHSVGISLVYKS
jgi:tRNA A58 N-methylase Trm61